MPLNKLAGSMIADRPLLGVGANNFALAMEPYVARDFAGDFLYTVHNTYLLVWAETGLGGLIAFVWLLIAILRQGSKCCQLRDPLFAPLALGCTAAVTGFMVQMSFDPFRSGAAIDLLWLVAGFRYGNEPCEHRHSGCSAARHDGDERTEVIETRTPGENWARSSRVKVAFVAFDFGEYCVRLASAIAQDAKHPPFSSHARSRTLYASGEQLGGAAVIP